MYWQNNTGETNVGKKKKFQIIIFQFMSRAAIFSFMPILTKILPESITNIERGRYYRNRFHEITEKWIREHRQDYRGNRTGDLQDAYLEKINSGEEHFSSEVKSVFLKQLYNFPYINRILLQLSEKFLWLELNLNLWWWGGHSDWCHATLLFNSECSRSLTRFVNSQSNETYKVYHF